MDAMKGNVLALAWVMPPLVFPRSLQVSRTMKALGQAGWRSSVVTVLPEAEQFATQDEKLASYYAGCYRLITVDPREDVQPSPSWLRIMRKMHPCEDVKSDNWIRRAAAALRKEFKREKHDVLVTFAQPWNDHLAGLRIKRQFPSLPWVAHFSDPWVDSPYAHFTSDEHKRLACAQERSIIEAANAVIFVNRYTADLVMSKYPASWQAKVMLVPHGYDDGLLQLIPEKQVKAGVMRIVHTGNFYGARNPELILGAIAELIEGTDIRSRLQVEFVGNVDEQFSSAVSNMGLDEVVVFSGRTGYLESLSVARSADLLLLMDAPAERNVFLPSKIVDYFMLRKPILGITPATGASAEVLRKLGCPVVPPDDKAAIVNALRVAFANWSKGQLSGSLPDASEVMAFDIHQTTLAFEHAIETAIGRNGKP